MTKLLSAQGIKKEFGDAVILNDVSFHIALGDRVGLVGINGAGKSTLANIIYGRLKPEGGSLLWDKKDIEIGYLKQDGFYSQRSWSGEEVTIQDSGYLKSFLEISSYLGIGKIDLVEEQRLASLSGGEKMKVALAHIWDHSPEFLILDEPTNHMDYQGMHWLIEALNKYKGTILVISHDRYFLDRVVNKIIEIHKGGADVYSGNYSFYKDEKRKRYESQLHQYDIVENNKAKIKEEISRLKSWSEKVHKDSAKKQREGLGKKEYFRMKAKKKDRQIKSKIKSLEKMNVEGIKKPEEDKKIDFRFNETSLKKTRMIEAVDIEKRFDSRILFSESSFCIMRGERVAIFGPNGCGKTTLLKMLLGKENVDAGEIFISQSINIGYLSQEALDLDTSKSVIDLFEFSSREEEGRIRTLLANMGFNEKMIRQPLTTLSLGELTRVRMTKLIIKQEDLLVLDEPLNHLDIYSREKLEEALKAYKGTIVLVSHDRYMIENLCDYLLVFEDNKIKKRIENPKDYLDDLFAKNKKNAVTSINNEKSKKEQKMLLENEIVYVLGELSKISPGTLAYTEMDLKFNELIKRKRSL
ncbi:ribosomal protection-like ABC-F family protein [Cellulosilyticum sp. I15G10I2]|uniref:ribosomal protection-like ABC-F family protein n=1 Tax=Cellulosilyticum sp. I15G10I2 TaxID=1892843 RepID=UPI00085C1093|nr:ABC-F type ribosomal protection protein [Cellulosilyticum sp. I15G10I2]